MDAEKLARILAGARDCCVADHAYDVAVGIAKLLPESERTDFLLKSLGYFDPWMEEV